MQGTADSHRLARATRSMSDTTQGHPGAPQTRCDAVASQKWTSHQQRRLNRVQLGPLACSTKARWDRHTSLATHLPHISCPLAFLLAAPGKTPRSIETRPKLIPAHCAQVCWKTHQKQKKCTKVQRRTCARTTTMALWELRKSRRCSSEHHEWCKHNPGDLGPECIDPSFSTKQAYPRFGHQVLVVLRVLEFQKRRNF